MQFRGQWEGISEHRLENGLGVLFLPDAARPVVTVSLTVFVGSKHEGRGESGAAHLLEHMLFRGTRSFPDVPRELHRRGARFNGTTWTDRTNYFETLPAEEDALEFALRLEAERLGSASLGGKDLEAERGVVLNELSAGDNDPLRVLRRQMIAVAYDWHGYGRSTIGAPSDVEQITCERLTNFYRRHYRPNNALLVVAGAIDEPRARDLVAREFGGLSTPLEDEPARPKTVEPPQIGERNVVVRRHGESALGGLCYHVPAASHPDFASLQLLDAVLTSEPSGRLYQRLVVSGAASAVGGGCFAWRDPGVYQLFAEAASPDKLDAVLDQMTREVESVGKAPPSGSDLELARSQLLNRRELVLADSSRLAVALSDWASQGDWRLFLMHRDRLEAATTEDLTRVAESYLVRCNRTSGRFIPGEPESAAIPAAPDLSEVFRDYRGRTAGAATEAIPADATMLEQRTLRGVGSWGGPFAWLAKPTRGGWMRLVVSLRFGILATLRGCATDAAAAAALILRGTESRTREAWRAELDRLGARIASSGTAGAGTFYVYARREHLAAVVDLLADALRRPAFRDEELAIWRRDAVASCLQSQSDPQSVAVREVRRALAPFDRDDPRYIPTFAELRGRIEATTVASIRAFYDRFYGAGAAECVACGDFDPAELQTLLADQLTGWASTESFERIPYPAVKGSIESPRTHLPDRKNACFCAADVFPLGDEHADFSALTAANYILGGASMSSRIGDRVRRSEGLSYTASSQFTASALEERARWSIYAIASPSEMERLRTCVREEIDRFLDAPPSLEELRAAVLGLVGKQRVTLSDDGSLNELLLESVRAGRTLERWEKHRAELESLTPEQVLEASRRWLKYDDWRHAEAGTWSDGVIEKSSP